MESFPSPFGKAYGPPANEGCLLFSSLWYNSQTPEFQEKEQRSQV